MGEPINNTNNHRVRRDYDITNKLNGFIVNEDGSVTHDALLNNEHSKKSKITLFVVLAFIFLVLMIALAYYFANSTSYEQPPYVEHTIENKINTSAQDISLQVEGQTVPTATDNIKEDLREITLKYFNNFNNQYSNLRKYSTSEWYEYCESTSSGEDEWSEGTNKFYSISMEMVINLSTLRIMRVDSERRTVKVKADYSLYWNDSEDSMGSCIWLVSFDHSDVTPKIRNIELLEN